MTLSVLGNFSILFFKTFGADASVASEAELAIT